MTGPPQHLRPSSSQNRMAATANASNTSAQAQLPPNSLPVMDFGVPGVFRTAMPLLLAFGINSYAPLMLVLGAVAAARSYVYQVLALFESHFSEYQNTSTCLAVLICISYGTSREALRPFTRHADGLCFLSGPQQGSKIKNCPSQCERAKSGRPLRRRRKADLVCSMEW